MAFSAPKSEESAKISTDKFSWTMYAPQMIMLTIAFVIGLYMPVGIVKIILEAVRGF